LAVHSVISCYCLRYAWEWSSFIYNLNCSKHSIMFYLWQCAYLLVNLYMFLN
jgi:hypothetical protein